MRGWVKPTNRANEREPVSAMRCEEFACRLAQSKENADAGSSGSASASEWVDDGVLDRC